MLPQATALIDLFQSLETGVVDDLFHNSPVGYLSLGSDARILIINDTLLRWFGYTREEVVGQLYYVLIPEADRDYVASVWSASTNNRNVKDRRRTYRRKDGSPFVALVNSTTIYDEDGQFLMSRTALVDITIQQELEDQIVQKNNELKHLNDQLTALNQAKNTFIGVVAHDLQNPITNLRMLAAKFRKTADTLTPRQRQWVDEVDETAQRMGHLIQQTLDVNRIERNANAPQFSDLDVLPLLDALRHRFAYIAERKSIRLHVLCEETPSRAYTDTAYLTEILENLVSNAIKFSPVGKSVRVVVHTADAWLHIAVIDEGPGIPTDEQPRLFGKYVTLSPRPTAGETSSGLGLSIAKDYAEQLGGSLHYEDRPDAGATFVLRLPIG